MDYLYLKFLITPAAHQMIIIVKTKILKIRTKINNEQTLKWPIYWLINLCKSGKLQSRIIYLDIDGECSYDL